MNFALSFTPLTPKDAAEVMKKCVRTLDNWCRDAVMPEPATLGGSRYWHPDVFYGWLDAKLKRQDWDRELLAQAANGAIAAFEPVTREDAAKVLKKTVRTVEDWYAEGVMPEPVVIGGTCYWHPEIFFSWLNARLKGKAWPPVASASNEALPELPAALKVPKDVAVIAAESAGQAAVGARTPKNGNNKGAASARGRARKAALLKSLNSA